MELPLGVGGLSICLLILMIAGGCDDGGTQGPPGSPAHGITCEGFPPPAGEQWTYRSSRTGMTWSQTTEEVDEAVGGYVVYRIHSSYAPPGLGQYVGCDPDDGEVFVATDSWEAGCTGEDCFINRYFWEPPMRDCPYGTAIGEVFSWHGVELTDGVVTGTAYHTMRVLAYETVSVPFGTIDNAMKVEFTGVYGEATLEPSFRWFDESIGLVRSEEISTGNAVELIGYSPPPGGK